MAILIFSHAKKFLVFIVHLAQFENKIKISSSVVR